MQYQYLRFAASTAVFTFALVCTASGVHAADDSQAHASIQARTQEFAKALEEGDAEKVAAFWTDQGEYVRDSVSIRGQKELTAAYQKYFESRPKLNVTVESNRVRLLAASTAIEDGRFLISNGDKVMGATGFSALYVKEDGVWSIALLREHADVPGLKDLEWLLGTWSTTGNGSEVETTYSWDHSKAFMRMEYTSKSEDGEETGSQMIGVDPVTGLPRSWLFSGDGGVNDGYWSRDGKKWIVEVSGWTADGGEVTARNILTPVDQDTFTWQSTERTLDGEPQPDTDVVKISRVQTEQ
ncbi:YybH family protein [Thalassoroseus pseudoceratinae]|uniref:YybH family protein n=1 Tax=Thalassoroseus pseudoceratinae TaxID=2713176 RepID=UPI0014246AFA|nr:SgcJ/EcaC family oxidoreductase [Thalassoroseus pseudoceratinae]